MVFLFLCVCMSVFMMLTSVLSGLNMAMHCLRKGYKNMVAYNRTTSKVDRLVEMGAKLATSPADVAKQSDVLFSMVGFPGDVRDILLHPTNGKEDREECEERQYISWFLLLFVLLRVWG